MDIEQEILSYLKLETGWRFGDGDVINILALINTFSLLAAARQGGLHGFHVCPIESGGIGFTMWYGDHELEFTIDDTIDYYLGYKNKDIKELENLTISEAITIIEEFTF